MRGEYKNAAGLPPIYLTNEVPMHAKEAKEFSMLTVVGLSCAIGVLVLDLSPPWFGLWHSVEHDPPGYLWHFVIGFIGIGIFFFTFLWEQTNRLSRHFKRSDATLIALRDSNLQAIEEMGSASELLTTHFDRLLRAAEEAKTVKNTLVFYSDSELPLNEARGYVSRSGGERRFDLIEKVVSQGHTWRDIHSERGISELNAHIEACYSAYRDFYFPYVMNATYPIVNCTVFRGGQRDEVWFGSGLFNEYNGTVFRTTNPRLCDYFEKYFDTIERDSRPWEAVRRQDIEGAWISVAYSDDGAIQDCAAVDIRLVGRALKVRGMVFEPEGEEYLHARSFNSTSSSFQALLEKAVLDFTIVGETDGAETKKGGGVYRFGNLDNLNFFEGHVFSQNGQTRKVAGHRVGQSLANDVQNRDTAKIRRLIRELVLTGFIAKHTPPSGDSPFVEGEVFPTGQPRRSSVQVHRSAV